MFALATLGALLCGCSGPHWLLGDSWIDPMSRYWHHTACEFTARTQGGRTAAEILAQDVPAVRAELAAVDPEKTPNVFLSAGGVDESFWGPEIAALLLDNLVDEILSAHPRVVVYQLDYLAESPPRFWSFTHHDQEPRWQRVTFDDLESGFLSGDGVHLTLPGYVERVLSLVSRYPRVVCWERAWALEVGT